MARPSRPALLPASKTAPVLSEPKAVPQAPPSARNKWSRRYARASIFPAALLRLNFRIQTIDDHLLSIGVFLPLQAAVGRSQLDVRVDRLRRFLNDGFEHLRRLVHLPLLQPQRCE